MQVLASPGFFQGDDCKIEVRSGGGDPAWIFFMQPIGRSALLEEVGESLVPSPLVANGGVLAEPEQHRAAASGEAQILSAAEAAAGSRESSPRRLSCRRGR